MEDDPWGERSRRGKAPTPPVWSLKPECGLSHPQRGKETDHPSSSPSIAASQSVLRGSDGPNLTPSSNRPPLNRVSTAGIQSEAAPAEAESAHSALEKRRHLLARRRARNQGCSGETPGGHRFPIGAARSPARRGPAPLRARRRRPGRLALGVGPWGLARAAQRGGRGAHGWGRRGQGWGGRVGGGSRTGLPSSADFMVPPAGGAGPKVSPLPQPAAGEPSGNLEGTGKLVLGIHAAAAARNRRRSGRSGHRRGRAPGKLTPRRTRAARAQSRASRRNVIQGRVRVWQGGCGPGPKRGGSGTARRGAPVPGPHAWQPDPSQRLCLRVWSLKVSL